ncbi:hypothetical protein A2U01_0111176, partial [Trifolium medium]|nr:hypothetical protein [Trifolium medium]
VEGVAVVGGGVSGGSVLVRFMGIGVVVF